MNETELPPETERSIRESFARQGLMRTFGATIERLELGRAVLHLPVTEAVSQQHGFVHAGASFALGDSAAGYAALSLMAPDAEVLTIEMKINMISPAIGRSLIAEGEVVKAGRRLTVVRSNVMTEDEQGRRKTVAILQGTMIPS